MGWRNNQYVIICQEKLSMTETLGQRIKRIRKGLNLNQADFALKIGLQSAVAISNYENDLRSPDKNKLIKISEVGKISLDELLTDVETPQNSQEAQPPSFQVIPAQPDFSADDFVFIRQVNGKISAGGGLMPEDSADFHSAFRRDWIKKRRGNPNTMSLIKVSGDSMEPTLLAGDLVLVDHSRKTIEPRGGIYAIVLDDEIMIKRIQRLFPKNKLRILSDNTHHPPIEADPDQVKINGKVIWFGRDMER